MKKNINVAIDGPAGAGKSTIARRAAEQLGFIYVDTGAMYRAMAYEMLSQGIDPGDSKAVAAHAADADITIAFRDGEQHVLLNGTDVSGLIRTPEVSCAASFVSAVPEVRAHLLGLQKRMAASENVIMDGRDIGTVVLPDADVKIFLTASAEVRGRRRYEELQKKGENVSLDQIIASVRERDRQDSERAVAPLKQAEDAVRIDSSDMTIGEVTSEIVSLVEKAMH